MPKSVDREPVVSERKSAIEALTAQVDRFLYDWQDTAELSTMASLRLVLLLFRSELIQDAHHELTDRLAKGFDPFRVSD